MGDRACLGPNVECYNVDWIRVGRDAIVSQAAYLCSASHDYRSGGFELISAPVEVEEGAWIAARAMLGPGVRVGRDAVVGMGAVVRRDVATGVVVSGNPAIEINGNGRKRAKE